MNGWRSILIFACVAITGCSGDLGPMPQFWRTERHSTLTEMLQEPGSSAYGTSIHVWVYQGADGHFDQIVWTGHADSSTCANFSGLIFNAYLQKHREPEDLLVAGTGFFKNRVDPELRRKLEKTAPVQKYLKIEDQLVNARFALRMVETRRSTPEDGRSAISAAKDDVSRLEKDFDDASKSGEVQQYLSQTRSPIALNRFIQEATRIGKDTGLVHIHRMDAGLATKALHRVEDALKSNRETEYVRFDDLAKESPDGKAVVMVPVTQLKTKQPLVLTLPLEKLDPKSLDKSREESRQEITFAMVGNAKSRLEYLNKKRQETADEIEAYQREHAAMSDSKRATARSRTVVLGRTITPDGEFKSQRQKTITLGEYIDFRLPANLQLFDQWIADTRELLDAISHDTKEGDEGAIDHLSYCTMVDSMLRDWDLPVARSQRAFEKWRANQRRPVWNALNELLESHGIKKEALSGENVVFAVSVAKDSVAIRPVHIVDLKNSVLLLDRRLGVSRVVDAWAERKEIEAPPLADDARDRQSHEAIMAMHAALQSSDRDAARRFWKKALEANARGAVESLLESWSSEFPANASLEKRLLEEVAPRISAMELIAEWDRINSDPQLKEAKKEGDYLLATYRFLEANPQAPVEWNLRFLLDLAGWISGVQNEFTHQASTRWEVLDRFVGADADRRMRTRVDDILAQSNYRGLNLLDNERRSGNSEDGENSPFYKARQAVSKGLLSGEDPAKLLKEVAGRARTVDADFFDRTLTNRAIPDEKSASFQRLITVTNRAFSEYEFDVFRLEKVRQMMKSRASADLASTLLWGDDDPPLKDVLQHVQDALQFDLSSQNTHFRAAEQKIQNVMSLEKGINRLEVLEIGSALDNGERWILSHSESDLNEDSRNRGLRDIALLRARLRFERGEYDTAINELFDGTVALALYHPSLTWTALADDWIGAPRSVRADLASSGIIHVVAQKPDEDHARGVLDISGLPADARLHLVKMINSAEPRDWTASRRVSEQILLKPIPGRPVLASFKKLFQGTAERESLIKAMVYGSVLPDAKSFPGSGRWLETSRSRPVFDRLLTSAGGNLNVPTVDEIVARIKSGEIVRAIVPQLNEKEPRGQNGNGQAP